MLFFALLSMNHRNLPNFCDLHNPGPGVKTGVELNKMKTFISIILAFFILIPIPVLAFTFRIQNNVDQKIFYSLYERDHGIKNYPWPVQRAAGELSARQSIELSETYKPGMYDFKWRDPAGTWKTEIEIEVDPSVTDRHTVTVELNPIIFEIRIFNHGTKTRGF